MTASWGGVGYLWNKPIFWCVLRPQRYTHELAQLSNAISLSFYGEEMRPALSYCGSHSGRDGDKASAAGLELCLDGDFAYYRGARMILMGRKCYVGQLKKEDFINMEIPKQCYPGDDYHFVYVCEIEKALLRN